MVGNVGICQECSAYSTSLISDPIRKIHLCPHCNLKLNPPLLILARPWNSEVIMDTTTKKAVRRRISDYQKCGFHLFQHKIFFNNAANPFAQEMFVLRYEGDYICYALEKRFHPWPMFMSKCRNINCF